MASLQLSGNDLHKAEMEYHGTFRYNLGRIRHIYLMCRIDICYTSCILETQTVSPTLTYFQGIKSCIKYLDSHRHKTILILLFIMMGQT